MKRLSRLLITAVFALCPLLAAQTWAALPGVPRQQADVNTATGKIIDNQGMSIIGAGVLVSGTDKGAITDIEGVFSIPDVAPGTVLEISYIGYKTQQVTWDGRALQVTLREDNELLDEVVVTALGISREKKSLGYAVQDVKSDALTKGGEVSLTDALQGKVAGLRISSSGTGAGGSTNVVIRGNSSLSDNNAPLYVVDGVPFDTKQDSNNSANEWGGTDRGGGAFDLNPEDIESVSVLKGPTAAALYGSRAGNGVILITTKRGGKREDGRWGVAYTGKVSFSPIAYSLNLQHKYGQGSDGAYSHSEYSWGGLLGDGSSTPAWYDETKTSPYIDNGDPMKAFYKVGFTQSHNVTVTGGRSQNPFRMTLGYDNTKGVTPGHTIEKFNVDVVDKFTVNKYLNFEVKANYVHTAGRNRPQLGTYGASYNLLQMPRNISVSDLEQYWVDPNRPGEYIQMNWWGPDSDHQNPYWIINQENNSDTKDRLFGMIAANINFTDHLTLKLKQGLDYAGVEHKDWYPYEDISFVERPLMAIRRKGGRELNSEILLSYNNRWKDWSFGASLGGNIMNNKQEDVYGNGSQFPSIGSQFIAFGQKQTASNDVYQKQINSIYGFVNLGYKEWLFLDVTARNDWSSTLPADNRSYFYPSVSVSGLLNGIFDAYNVSYDKNVLDYGKIRFSFAQVGKDTDPYQLYQTYGADKHAFNLLYTSVNTTKANAELKPEIATSWEVGTEWHFFKNRFGFDITYYNTVTKNQVMALTQPVTTGYEAAYQNVGQISNQGVEIMINGDFVRTRDIDFGAVLNLAHNVSIVDKLSETTKMYSLGQLGTVSSSFQVIAKEGEKLGLLYDYGYKRDDNGNIVVGEDGIPLKSDNQQVLGCIQPDLTGSFNLNFRYKGLNIGALFNFQSGGNIFSATEMTAAKLGTAACTENREDFVFPGVTESGAPNTTPVSAQAYWMSPNVERFIYDASYLKLQEVSISYNFAKKLIQNSAGKGLDFLKISIYGTNLCYLLKHTPGTTPDGSYASASMFGSAIDMLPIPNTRNFGLSLNIGF